MHALTGMGLLSAAVLLSQVALIRVFSVAQFYHFAFLVISLALLGFGASGSLLALWPRLRAAAWWPWYALGFGLATPVASFHPRLSRMSAASSPRSNVSSATFLTALTGLRKLDTQPLA